MDASLAEKLHTFAEALRRLNPSFQEAVDRLVQRLKASPRIFSCPARKLPMQVILTSLETHSSN
jgi:hypothetical protein